MFWMMTTNCPADGVTFVTAGVPVPEVVTDAKHSDAAVTGVAVTVSV